jgi:hypothetical protein
LLSFTEDSCATCCNNWPKPSSQTSFQNMIFFPFPMDQPVRTCNDLRPHFANFLPNRGIRVPRVQLLIFYLWLDILGSQKPFPWATLIVQNTPP